MNDSKFQKDVDSAIKWIATEHNYFLELISDLKSLKMGIDSAKEMSNVASIKSALRDIKYIGKSERRFNRYEHHVEVVLEKINSKVIVSGSADEVERLLKRLKIEAADLIRSASLHDGRIKDYLVLLRDEIKDHEIEKAHATIKEIDQAIEDAEIWISALSVDLKKAKLLSYKEFSGMSIEDVREHISHLSVNSKLNYLSSILARKKLLAKGTINAIVELILEISTSIDLLRDAINIFEQSKLEEAVIRSWRLMGDMFMVEGKHSLHGAIDCYVKALIMKSDWKKVGDKCLPIEGKHPNKAFKAYEKAGYGKSDWNKLGDFLLSNIPHYAMIAYGRAIQTKKGWKLIGDNLFNLNHYYEASEAYKHAEEFKLAAESAIKSNDKGGNYHIDPAPLYELVGEWKTAGDYWSKRPKNAVFSGDEQEKAAIAYEKAEEWKLAGEKWICVGFKEGKDFSGALRCFSNIGFSKKKIWKMIGDYGWNQGIKWTSRHMMDLSIRSDYMTKTAQAYEQAEEWDLAIKSYLDLVKNCSKKNYELNIGKIYLKTGHFKLAYELFDRLGKGKEAHSAYRKAKSAGQI